ncbi:MAG: addiction module protein [Chitinophagales bacterium]|nr:addiction module protein [Chitinophagales bacterium]
MDLQHYKHLSTSEKVLLVEEIWDSIAEDAVTLSKENKKLLEERLSTYNSSSKRTSWETIKKKVRSKNKK